MSDTLYLQLDQNIQINHPHIYLQDIAKLSCIEHIYLRQNTKKSRMIPVL